MIGGLATVVGAVIAIVFILWVVEESWQRGPHGFLFNWLREFFSIVLKVGVIGTCALGPPIFAYVMGLAPIWVMLIGGLTVTIAWIATWESL